MNIRDIFKRGTLKWGLLAFVLIVGAMLVPVDWVQSVGGIFGAPREAEVDAFSDEVVRVDDALQAGSPLSPELLKDGGQKLESMRVFLQVRRLTRTGPITVSGMDRAADIFREFNPQIQNQTLQGSREALRRERDRRIGESDPRLDRAAIRRELRILREQIATATQNPRP